MKTIIVWILLITSDASNFTPTEIIFDNEKMCQKLLELVEKASKEPDNNLTGANGVCARFKLITADEKKYMMNMAE